MKKTEKKRGEKEMAEYWKYEGICQLPTSLSDVIKNEWEQTLKSERQRILDALTTKIASSADFQNKIADASSDRYEAFLASVGSGWDKDLITIKQRVKLARAYDNWLNGITNAFAEGGTFETNVTNKKDKLDALRYVIGAVGHKALATWEPVVIGALLLTGDTRPTRYFDANDTLSGTHEGVFDPAIGRFVVPSIIAKATQAVVIAKYADEGGLTTIRDSILSNANTVIDNLVNVALDETHKGSGYDVTYVLSWDTVSGHVKVTVTDIHPS